MMRLGGRSVKRAGRLVAGVLRPFAPPPGKWHEGEWYGASDGLSNKLGADADPGQKSPVCTSRMKAAALNQHSSASSTEPVAPNGPTRTT